MVLHKNVLFIVIKHFYLVFVNNLNYSVSEFYLVRIFVLITVNRFLIKW